jgi:hypothetical protein
MLTIGAHDLKFASPYHNISFPPEQNSHYYKITRVFSISNVFYFIRLYYIILNKNEVNVKVKLTLKQAMKDQRGSKGVALLCL